MHGAPTAETATEFLFKIRGRNAYTHETPRQPVRGGASRAKDVTMTTDEDADRAREILAWLIIRSQEAIWVLAYIIEADRVIPQIAALDDDAILIAQFAAFDALQALAMNIARTLDIASSDRDSLPSLFGLLKKPDVTAAVSTNGKPAHLQCAFDLWDQLKTNQNVPRLKDLRNRRLAHNLSKGDLDIGSEIPGIAEVAEQVFAIVDELCLGCYSDSSIGELRARAASAAGRFWQRFTI
jgi:hypothetical protein